MNIQKKEERGDRRRKKISGQDGQDVKLKTEEEIEKKRRKGILDLKTT